MYLTGLVLSLTLLAMPVAAQTPTPPWPTPIATTDYIIRQEVTYGEGGVIVAVLFMAGLVLLDIALHVVEKVMDK